MSSGVTGGGQSSTDVLQSAASFSEQGEGVVDEAALRLPERREGGEGDVFPSSGQQVGAHLKQSANRHVQFRAVMFSRRDAVSLTMLGRPAKSLPLC